MRPGLRTGCDRQLCPGAWPFAAPSGLAPSRARQHPTLEGQELTPCRNLLDSLTGVSIIAGKVGMLVLVGGVLCVSEGGPPYIEPDIKKRKQTTFALSPLLKGFAQGISFYLS